MADLEPYTGVFSGLTPQGRMHRQAERRHSEALQRDRDKADEAIERIVQSAEMVEVGLEETYEIDIKISIHREFGFASPVFEHVARGMEVGFGDGVRRTATKHMKGKL